MRDPPLKASNKRSFGVTFGICLNKFRPAADDPNHYQGGRDSHLFKQVQNLRATCLDK